MKFYVIAGEASGDLHGSNLVKAIQNLRHDSEFRAWGGDRMAEAGADLVKHYKELAFMGFTEVLLNLRTILGNLDFCKKDIEAYQPDALILIDYPGFNMRIARWAKERGIRVIYYISPQIWAWKENRVNAIKRDVDLMLVILPFEKEFYARHGMEVTFTGHPLLDAIHPDQAAGSPISGGEKPLLALVPGSRKQEVKRMLPEMLRAAESFPEFKPVVAGAPSLEAEFYLEVMGRTDVPVVFGRTHDIFRQATVGLVTSGTATLEAALLDMPQAVCYRGGRISYLIARSLVKVKFISLVNLILNREVVTELIQSECNSRRMTEELLRILRPEVNARIKGDYAYLREVLGGSGASQRAAEALLKSCESGSNPDEARV
jgi:lipid-A-disaccharide synthase